MITLSKFDAYPRFNKFSPNVIQDVRKRTSLSAWIDVYTASGSAGSAEASESAVAQPFGDSEREQQRPEGKAHERDNQCEPSRVCACACRTKSTKHCLEKDGGKQASSDDR